MAEEDVPKGDELKQLVFQLFNEYDRKGTLNEMDTVYDIADRTGATNAQAETWKQQYLIEKAKRKKDQTYLKQEEIKTKYQTEKMQMDICPNCMNLRSQLDEKNAEYRDLRTELKADLREARQDLERYKAENFKLIKSETEAETYKSRVSELERVVGELRQKLDSEKDNRHSLEVQKSVLEVKNEMITKREPDEEMVLLRKMIYDKGFARMTGDDPSSETLQLVRSIGEMAPNVIKEGAELISEIRSDRDPQSNPYPEGGQPHMKRQPSQARRSNPSRQPMRQPAPQAQPNPAPAPKPVSQTESQLNKLGQAFSRKYPKIPLDLVGPVSDHLMSVYQNLEPAQMAMMMNKTFQVITNLREVGVHIKNIMSGKNYPLINRAIQPSDAAEILWKEKPEFAEKLKEMTYAELMGLLYPIRDHATYGKDVEFFSREEVGHLIDRILDAIREYASPEELPADLEDDKPEDYQEHNEWPDDQ